jgi:hypothetical protein
MSRRSGQRGRVERKGKCFYARFWLDSTDGGVRKYACVRICPVSGPGSLNASERKRRLLEIVQASGANSEEKCREACGAFLGITFAEQSEQWLVALENRRRRPVKPKTLSCFRSALKYVNEKLGAVPLANLNNSTLKTFVSEMAAETLEDDRPRFGAKSIANYTQIVKFVVASALDAQGEQQFPRKWNTDFLDLPQIADQRRPCFSAVELQQIINRAEGQDQILFALLAGTGVRIGEAIALRVQDVDGSVIHIRHSLWNGVLGSPKTKQGVRDVDLPSDLARVIQLNIAGLQPTSFVFQNEAGGALHQSNVLRRSLHPLLKSAGLAVCGFHSFRRFRVTHLRRSRVPEDLIRFWIGHSAGSITDKYSRIADDVEFRQRCAQQCGLGFDLPRAGVARNARNFEASEVALSA